MMMLSRAGPSRVLLAPETHTERSREKVLKRAPHTAIDLSWFFFVVNNKKVDCRKRVVVH